ncbi:MAG TPA: hypothetical protein V6C78_18605 [Crinalium sp.]|jgi:hypothetical protein
MSPILPSTSLINGNTQQKLADQWWAKVFSTSADNSTIFLGDKNDPRGRRGSLTRHQNYQSTSPKGVSFLVEVFGGGTATRTIVGKPNTIYFAPFVNTSSDNTTDNVSPSSGFPGGFALTPKHAANLKAQGKNPRILSPATPTLLDFVRDRANGFKGQFAIIDGKNATPRNIQKYRQETADVGYSQLPRSTGALYPPDIFVADPDLGTNLENTDPADDTFPRLSEINPTGKNAVIPLVQAGYYFAFKLDPGSHTVRFGATSANLDVTYNVLNPISGTSRRDNLVGTKSNDYLKGGNGKDTLTGNRGNDLLVGGNGDDVLDGGRNNDELWGDGGNDTFIFKPGYGKDSIFDLQAGDRVNIRSFNISDPLTIGRTDIKLDSGLDATRLSFGGSNQLTLVGIHSADLNITKTSISLI